MKWDLFSNVIAVVENVNAVVILQDLPPELPLNFLRFINNFLACRPAACKKFRQSHSGYRDFDLRDTAYRKSTH